MPPRSLHRLYYVLCVQTLCSRASPAHAFAWPSAVVTSASQGVRARPFSTVPPQRVSPRGGRVRRAMFGALPVSATLAAGSMQLRATSSSSGPDETWEVVRTPGDGSCLFHAVEVCSCWTRRIARGCYRVHTCFNRQLFMTVCVGGVLTPCNPSAEVCSRLLAPKLLVLCLFNRGLFAQGSVEKRDPTIPRAYKSLPPSDILKSTPVTRRAFT